MRNSSFGTERRNEILEMNELRRAIIRSAVQKSIREIRQDPKRGIRKMVDLALHFSHGRFQRKILEVMQKELSNPSSAYYSIVTDLAANVKPENLEQFGMDLGYNSWTHGAQIILLAGDLLDSGSPYPETAKALAETFAGCASEVFLAPGNHDYYSAGAPYARLTFPENVHIFRTQRIEAVALPELGVRVWGAAFTDSRCPALLRGFSVPKEPGMLDVLCMHAEVGNPASAYNPVSAADLAHSGLDYAAFGHTHRFGGVQRAGGTVYAWPGCMEGRGFDETGEKGVLLVDVAAGDVQAQFLPVPGRRYEILRVDVTDADPVQAVLAALPEGAARNICRIVLTGETDRAPNPAALRAALEGRVFAMQLRDETRARRDLWARAGEGTLRGQFLAQLKQKYDAADSDRDRETIVMAARWGLAALDHDEEVVTL